MSGTVPEDICNRALDSIGSSNTIGDLQEGTKEAKVCARHYSPLLTQVLRAALWNFSRKAAALTLLQDSTGQTKGVGTGTIGMRPWVYEYQWPIDGVQARWLPVSMFPYPSSPPGNITLPPTPPYSGFNPNANVRQVPARFLVTQDNVTGGGLNPGVPTNWNSVPGMSGIQGQGRASQTVILTNQPQATLVYTMLVQEPDVWDPLFQQAMVAMLASYIAMGVLDDKKFAMQMRAQQTEIARKAIEYARVRDGDEGWAQADLSVDWIRIRGSGGGAGWGADGWQGPGVLGYGWGSCSFADGAVF